MQEILKDVNAKVAEKEREQRFLEIYKTIDAKSSVLHQGRKFKKSDVLSASRRLMFEGTASLLQPSGGGGGGGSSGGGGAGGGGGPRSVPVVVVVLSDILFFLHENNQKYYFLSPEGKVNGTVRFSICKPNLFLYYCPFSPAWCLSIACWCDGLRTHPAPSPSSCCPPAPAIPIAWPRTPQTSSTWRYRSLPLGRTGPPAFGRLWTLPAPPSRRQRRTPLQRWRPWVSGWRTMGLNR